MSAAGVPRGHACVSKRAISLPGMGCVQVPISRLGSVRLDEGGPDPCRVRSSHLFPASCREPVSIARGPHGAQVGSRSQDKDTDTYGSYETCGAFSSASYLTSHTTYVCWLNRSQVCCLVIYGNIFFLYFGNQVDCYTVV